MKKGEPGRAPPWHDPKVRALASILSMDPQVDPIASTEEWWARHQAVTAGFSLPIEEALMGGFAADRLGYAFASGYEAALHFLVPDLPRDQVASLSVTERGGAHPSAIETRITPHGNGRWKIDGKKRWATCPREGGVFLVAASEGKDAEGKNRLRVVRVASGTPGVFIDWMPEPPFVPEIAHVEIRLEGVVVPDEAILPGDGYTRYVKPFRTVEDIHVHAAVLAYLVREVRAAGFGTTIVEELAADVASVYGLAAADPSAPEVHIAITGVLRAAKDLIARIEAVWARTESPAHARWERDRMLFSVAESTRAKRVEAAWRRVGSR